uniref:Uncharacterized protein n=1 Tax=Aegilops tauschii subsp. strangulata TaxID=200361 RepID=A0A453DMB1_AEGTS
MFAGAQDMMMPSGCTKGGRAYVPGQRLLRPAGAWCPAWSRRTTEKSPSLGAVEEDVRDGDVPVNHPSISSARPCLDLEAGMIAGGVVLVAPSPRPQIWIFRSLGTPCRCNRSGGRR